MIVTCFRSYVDNNDSEKSIFRLQLRIEFLIFAEKKRHLSLITTGFMPNGTHFGVGTLDSLGFSGGFRFL